MFLNFFFGGFSSSMKSGCCENTVHHLTGLALYVVKPFWTDDSHLLHVLHSLPSWQPFRSLPPYLLILRYPNSVPILFQNLRLLRWPITLRYRLRVAGLFDGHNRLGRSVGYSQPCVHCHKTWFKGAAPFFSSAMPSAQLSHTRFDESSGYDQINWLLPRDLHHSCAWRRFEGL